MKLIHTNKKIVFAATVIGVSLLGSPVFTAAETSIYQEVITSSNTGGQQSTGKVTTGKSSSVGIISNTNVNGQTYQYYFSTSTPDGIIHRVTLENGVPVSTDTSISSVSGDANMSAEEYQTWIADMISLLNYLQLYVSRTF